jgi:hypothetical protein
MLTRTHPIEEDLVDQLFNSTEKRLARTLLRLAGSGEPTRLTAPLRSSLKKLIFSATPRRSTLQCGEMLAQRA